MNFVPLKPDIDNAETTAKKRDEKSKKINKSFDLKKIPVGPGTQ